MRSISTGGSYGERLRKEIEFFVSENFRAEQRGVYSPELVSWIDESWSTAIWPSVEFTWEAQWELDGEVVHREKECSVDYVKSELTTEGNDEDELEEDEFGRAIFPPGTWGEPKPAFSGPQPRFNKKDVVMFRGGVYPLSVMDSFNPNPPEHAGFPPLHEGVHSILITENKSSKCWHPWSENPGAAECFGSWKLIYVDGRHAGESFALPFNPSAGRSGYCDKGYWIRDGMICWLSHHQLACARGMVPGSEPWKKTPKPIDLLGFITAPKPAIQADPIVHGLIDQRDFFVIAGHIKSRKTTMMLDLAVALTSAGQWLKWKAAEELRVLYLDAEMTQAEINTIIRESCRRRGLDVQAVMERLKPIPFKESGHPVRAKDIFKMSHSLAEFRVDVLMVDNWRCFLPPEFEEHIQRHALKTLSIWKEIQKNMGPKVAVIMAAHSKPDIKKGGDPLAVIGGHNSIGGVVNGGLAILKGDGYKGHMEYDCRSHPRGDFPVKVPNGSRFWEIDSDGRRRPAKDRDEPVAENDMGADIEAADALADAITVALHENEGPQSVNFLKGAVKGRAQSITSVIDSMVLHKKLSRHPDGKVSITPPR